MGFYGGLMGSNGGLMGSNGKSLGSSKKNSMNTYQWILINVIHICLRYFVLMFEVGIWLVVSTILKKMKVNRKDYPIYIYIMENNPHVPNHQPDNEIEYP